MRWLPPNSGLSSFPVLALHISSFHGRETLRHGRVIRRRLAAWVEVMKERDDVRHLLRRQDKTRHITVTDLKTIQERRLQSIDRILPVEISQRRCEPVGARIGFADGMTTRASPLRQVVTSRHLSRAPGSRKGGGPRQQQADCNGFLPHAESTQKDKNLEKSRSCRSSTKARVGFGLPLPSFASSQGACGRRPDAARPAPLDRSGWL
ncbi:hypothetical protein SAMN02927924_03518 [Sphingobium faniae]|nr:hypothetical protein SAMN02927924_03518 [Sphingobium faniae]